MSFPEGRIYNDVLATSPTHLSTQAFYSRYEVPLYQIDASKNANFVEERDGICRLKKT